MRIAIHQPNYLPWIGYFFKMSRCDVFVLLDDVQFTKGGFQNRNRIKTSNGVSWLTVPVLTKGRTGQSTNQVLISNGADWRKKHWRTISQNYGRARYFSEYSGAFADIYAQEWTRLVHLNEALINVLAEYLEINSPILKSSTLGVKGQSTERLISICKALGADTYLSGFGGRSYQAPRLFAAAGIELEIYNFKHPTYPQLWGDFVANLSIIDLLFNCGVKSRKIILSSCS